MRLAQRLLGHALNETNFAVDGVFTDDTTKQIELFQTQVLAHLGMRTHSTHTQTHTRTHIRPHARVELRCVALRVRQAGLVVNGFLNADTWPTLLGGVSPLPAGPDAPAVVVQALQDSLAFNGFPTPISGIFDAATSARLASFQVQPLSP